MFLLLFLSLCYPLMEQGIKITHFAHKLDGTSIKPERVPLSLENITNNTYQNNREERLKYNLYIKGFFIRLNNQLKYWAFNKLRGNGAVEGKEKYLYYSNFIDEFYGFNYIGEEKILERINELKTLSDSLNNHQVKFMFIIAPNKARVYGEYIPDNYIKLTSTPTNYDVFIAQLQRNQIEYLDLNGYFTSLYGTTDYPLFTKGGIHWSDYGSYIGLDSIISKIEVTLDTQLLTPIRKDTLISKKPKKEDNDIANVNNLLFLDEAYYEEKLAYFSLGIDSSKGSYKPNVLVISDSFYWNLYHNKVPHKLFDSKSSFWYYNSSIWPDSEGNGTKNVTEIKNMRENLYSRDIVLFMITEGNLHSCCWEIGEKIIDKIK